MKIKVVENVLKLNDEVANWNRQTLAERGVACVDLIGSPGCGKTTMLERALEMMKGEFKVGVLTGDLATTRDAERLSPFASQVTQINTGKSCHLDANQVRQGMESFNLDELDLMIVENVGNLICPVGFDLGQGAKVGMFSVTEGDDKPAKHPYVILESDVVLLNKTDLLPYVSFDLERFRADLRSVRGDIECLEISSTTGKGLEGWVGWLRAFVAANTASRAGAECVRV